MQNTALTVVQRASLALESEKHEKKLRELAARYGGITTITNNAGHQECHAARMALKNERVQLEKEGKAARDDAAKFQKAVIDEQRRLIGIIEPEELRLEKLQSEWEAKMAAEKAAKERAEKDRVDRIMAAITAISDIPVHAHGKSSAEILAAIELAERQEIGPEFAEHQDRALTTKDAAIQQLKALHQSALEREAEAERLRLERQELARLRAEQEQRQREADARAAEERRKREEEERAAREKIEAEERAARERIEAQEREARKLREEAERAAREAREAEDAKMRAERDRLEAARRAVEERERKMREEVEAKQREIAAAQAELMDGHQLLETFVQRFGKRKEFMPVVSAIKAFLAKHKVTA